MGLHLKNTLHQEFHHNDLLGTELRDLLEQYEASGDIPSDIFAKLAKLKLLLGVPLHYLIPHRMLLPPESIKFFYIDNNWVNALVDGAYNIGRYAAKDKGDALQETMSVKLDKAFVHDVHLHSNQSAHMHRNYMLKMHEDIRDLSNAITDGEQALVLSGFLLRSEAVGHWKDLQVDAYPTKAESPDKTKGDTTNVKTNRILRFERLNEELLIAIFVGDFYRVDIHQPSQGLHFGFDKKEGKLTKDMRATTKNEKDQTLADIPFREATMNVVDMTSLAKEMAQGLKDKPDYCKRDANDQLLASDFGLQMIEGVGMVRFIRDQPSA